MRKPLVVQLASLLIAAAILVFGSSFDASAAKKCITIGQKSVCFDDGKGKKNNDADDAGNKDDGAKQDEQTKDDDTPKVQSKPFTCENAKCEAGTVVLDKPNKYGACCQPIDSCPPERPSGTPPNCCPQGTTFREGFCRPTDCPPGTVGTPPHCQRVCGPGKVLVDQSCYDPCPSGTIGTPPSCRCPDGQIWDNGANACKERPKCTGGMVGTPPNCQCPPKTILKDGTCQACPSGQVAVNGKCQCSKGTAPDFNGICQKCEGGRVPIDGRCRCPQGTMAYPGSADNCVKGTREVCTWRGTAPACDGSCEAGEEYRGASDSASGEFTGGGPTPGGFGSSCWSGSKHLCCRPE